MHADKWTKHFSETVNAGLDGQIVSVTVGETQLECIIASVHASRVQGLSEHAELPYDGMIFIYDADHTAKFQRTSMSMDVSIWFFDAEGNLVGNGWTDEVATSSEPYRYVLETDPDAEMDGALKLGGLLPAEAQTKLYYFEGRNTPIAATSPEAARKKKKRGGDKIVKVRSPNAQERKDMRKGRWVRTRKDGKSPKKSKYGKGRGYGPPRK